MRALITGATGFLGGVLASRVAALGGEVRALVRSENHAAELQRLGVKSVLGDISRQDTLVRAMEGMDVVFHLAGLRRAAAREPFFEVNAEGTRNVCEAMSRARVRRLVLASSLAVHGPSNDGTRHVEIDPYAPAEWYGESKVEAERIAKGFTDRLEVVISRPSRIMGPGDRENLPFFKLVRRGYLIGLGGPTRPLSLVDVDDCADHFVLCAQHPKAVGEAFLCSGREDVTLEGIQREAARALGMDVKRLEVPEGLLKGAAVVADGLSKVSGRTLPLGRKLARQLLAPGWTCSSQKSQDVLGWTPRFGPAESIARTAVWYREHRWI